MALLPPPRSSAPLPPSASTSDDSPAAPSDSPGGISVPISGALWKAYHGAHPCNIYGCNRPADFVITPPPPATKDIYVCGECHHLIITCDATHIHVKHSLHIEPARGPIPTESVLAEAHRLVSGDRNGSYGPPENDFAKTAKIWTGLLLPKLKDGAEITPVEVALMMVGLKLAREVFKHKRDNLVDAAGYTRCAALITGEDETT